VRFPRRERRLAQVEAAIRAAGAAENWEEWAKLTRDQQALAREVAQAAERDERRGMHGRDQGKAQDEGAAEVD
jgi:hypothetical protein